MYFDDLKIGMAVDTASLARLGFSPGEFIKKDEREQMGLSYLEN